MSFEIHFGGSKSDSKRSESKRRSSSKKRSASKSRKTHRGGEKRSEERSEESRKKRSDSKKRSASKSRRHHRMSGGELSKACDSMVGSLDSAFKELQTMNVGTVSSAAATQTGGSKSATASKNRIKKLFESIKKKASAIKTAAKKMAHRKRGGSESDKATEKKSEKPRRKSGSKSRKH